MRRRQEDGPHITTSHLAIAYYSPGAGGVHRASCVNYTDWVWESIHYFPTAQHSAVQPHPAVLREKFALYLGV